MKTTDLARFKKLDSKVTDALLRLESAIAKKFPVGTQQEFWLMHGQKNASVGRVQWHAGAIIGVALLGTGSIKRVHYSYMVQS